jgi:HK97 family phage major capsid protein
MQFTAGSRALPRASREDMPAILDTLNRGFEELRGKVDAHDKAIAKGFDDVVAREGIERINASVGEHQRTLDDLRREMNAARLAGPAQPGQLTPEQAEHRQAFHAWFRNGKNGDNLPGLAIKAALQTQSDPDGGLVVPFTMETTIDRVLAKYSAVRSLARVIQISTMNYKKPVNLGGAAAGWVTETAARPATNTPTLSELDFPAMEEYANPAATQAILDDASIDIEAWLADEVGVKFAEQEGLAFVSGSGTGQPRGIISYDIVANGSYSWGKVGYIPTGAGGASGFPADATQGDCILNLIYALKRGYRQNASFLSNDLTLAAIRKFKDNTGQYLWQPSVQQGQPATLNGYPIESDDNMQDVGANNYPLAFADWSQAYLIVDRAGVRVLRDPFTNKPYVQFYTTKRVGGGIQNFEAIKLLKIATS